MTRNEWYALFHDVRTPCFGLNLFRHLEGQSPASVALEIAQEDRREAWRQAQAKKYGPKAH